MLFNRDIENRDIVDLLKTSFQTAMRKLRQRLQLFANLVSDTSKTNPFRWTRLLVALLAFEIIQLIAVGGGSFIDGAWTLPPPSRGLSNHYGVLSVLITNPLFVASIAYIYDLYRRTLTSLPLSDASFARLQLTLERRVSPMLSNLHRTFVYLLMVAVGIASVGFNFIEVIHPRTFYGIDVFDSSAHFWSYATTRALAVVTWVIVYPAVFYAVIVLSVAARSITDFFLANKLTHLSITHPDGSYGLRKLASLHASLLVPYLLIFVVMFSLMSTHTVLYSPGNTNILIVLLACITIVGIFVYFIIVPFARLVRQTHAAAFERLLLKSQSKAHSEREYQEYLLERLCYTSVDRYFYLQGIRIALQLLIPIAGFSLKFLGISP